jgi:hypothetical protein
MQLSQNSAGDIMKKHLVTLFVVGWAFGIVFTGCDTAAQKLSTNENEKIAAAQQSLKLARLNYLAVWQKFNLETQREIELNEMKIDVIKDIMVNSGPSAIKKYKIEMHSLQRMNRELKAAIEQYRYDGHPVQNEPADRIAMN